MSIIDVNNGIPANEQVTAIVNPLSLDWMSDPHGGTCGAILRAAGFDTVFNTLRSTFHLYHAHNSGIADVSDITFTTMTDGFNLRKNGITTIIHTVGPDRVSGTTATSKQKEALMTCYRKCLEQAMSRGIRKIAFPSIATGALNFPPKEAAQIAMETVRSFVQLHPRTFDSIQWVLWDDATYNTYANALSKI